MDSKKDIIIPFVVAVVLIGILVVFSIMSSGNEEVSVVDTMDQNNEQYMSTELVIKDEVVGTGAEAKATNRVFVNYVGRFEDGKLFDTNNEEIAKAEGVYNPARAYESFAFILGTGQVIAGWDQGVAGMKVGGKRTLVIPSDLAYGPNDYGPIPGGSTLVFDVELLDVQEGTPDLP